MDYKAVLFDLDGTLLDTIEDLADSMNAALASLGLPTHPVEAYKYFVGDGLAKMAERALADEVHEAETIEKCMAAFEEEYAARWRCKTRPYPGVAELLDACSARGVKMAVLSNKPHEATRQGVEALLAGERFDIVVGARPAWPVKPDPAAALDIAERLAVPPARFLYLGDTGTDMKTARAAGMFPVGALWGFRTAEELLANGAKVLVERPEEVLGLLE